MEVFETRIVFNPSQIPTAIDAYLITSLYLHGKWFKVGLSMYG